MERIGLVDMRMVRKNGNELYGKRVGTLGPGNWRLKTVTIVRRGTFCIGESCMFDD